MKEEKRIKRTPKKPKAGGRGVNKWEGRKVQNFTAIPKGGYFIKLLWGD